MNSLFNDTSKTYPKTTKQSKENLTTTTNGAIAYSDTNNPVLDLFAKIGSLRKSGWQALDLFENAFAHDKELTAATLAWVRDFRHSGAGERETFRILLAKMIETDNEYATILLNLVPFIGRFDDLRVAYGTKLESFAVDLWIKFLKEENALAAKWISLKKDKPIKFGLGFKTEREFRKYIVPMRKHTIVEHLMSQGNWDLIAYDKLPSVASSRYSKAFMKHDEARYSKFIDSEGRMNMSSVFPHDVVRAMMGGADEAAVDKMWSSLEVPAIDKNILVIADVSGSMGVEISGSVEAIHISIALAVLFAEKIEGRFHDKFITFSENPSIIDIGRARSLREKLNLVARSDWGMNTDFQKAYRTILDDAIQNNVPKSEMPEYLLVLSDMQFDESQSYGYRGFNGNSLFGVGGKETPMTEEMRRDFIRAGHDMPKTLYWNLNGQHDNSVGTEMSENIAMISGYNPSLLNAVLAGDDFSPLSVMERSLEPFVKMIRGTYEE